MEGKSLKIKRKIQTKGKKSQVCLNSLHNTEFEMISKTL